MKIGENTLTRTDSYKQTHWKFYPPGLTTITSYLESRRDAEIPYTVFFGLQYMIKEYLEGEVVTQDMIREAGTICEKHFGSDEFFNYEGWQYIVDEWGGYLPVEIRAVPEGKLIPNSNAMLTIENTDPRCPWVVNFLETLLVQLWYPCTVATISRYLKEKLHDALRRTGDVEKLPFMLHDFGYRGSTSVESAALGGAAHLVNFVGTDTLAGIELLRKYYYADMPGLSVPATEHSTITTWGEDGELDAFQHILNQVDSGIVSVVSDSWDIYRAAGYWTKDLREQLESNPNRTVVVRPDSGDPEVVVPNLLYEIAEEMGYTVNEQGYKVLPDCIRVIQGDGITRHSLPKLIDNLVARRWSLDNIVFGSGGGLLQQCDRDTQSFAMKCSSAVIDGERVDVYKQPATDPMKNSKRGELKLIRDAGTYKTVQRDAPGDDIMQTVFYNGELEVAYDIDLVRQNADLTNWQRGEY